MPFSYHVHEPMPILMPEKQPFPNRQIAAFHYAKIQLEIGRTVAQMSA
jgi:hypothetical protein